MGIAFENSVDPDQMASKKPSDQDLHCFSYSLWIYKKKQNWVVWLVDSQKWV